MVTKSCRSVTLLVIFKELETNKGVHFKISLPPQISLEKKGQLGTYKIPVSFSIVGRQ